ncbi:At rich interactive domain protein, partial [Rhizopus stolonifer]
MNQQNPNIPTGQPNQLGQPNQQQNPLNLNLQNEVPNANWREELSVQDRARFVSQLGNALKHLSPATSDADIFAAAKNFELTLYTRSTSKNQYILAYARKFHQIKFQLQSQNGGTPMLNDSQLQLNLNTLNMQPIQQLQNLSSSPLNLTQPQPQQQQQQSQNNQNQIRPNMFQQNMMQARPPQQPQQQVNQGMTPQQPQAQNQQQAQLQLLQRTAAQAMAAAAAAGNNNTNGNTAAQMAANVNVLQQQQIPLNVLQNLNMGNVNQAAMTMSPRQFQMYLARQIAMHQNNPQQSQDPSVLMNNQAYRPPVSGVNATSSPMQVNNFPGGQQQQQQLNPELLMQHLQAQQARAHQQQQQQQQMAQQQPQQQAQSQAQSQNQQNQQQQQAQAQVAAQAQQEAQQQAQAQAQQLAAQQQLAQQQQQQAQQQLAAQQAQQLAAQQQQQQQQAPPQQQQQQQQAPPQQQQQQQQPPQSQTPQNGAQPVAGSGRAISFQQRAAAAEIVRQIDESIRSSRVHANPIEGLSEQEKAAIREHTALMKPMYDKIDNLLPVFLALTSNMEATRRLILMKYMFEDQLSMLGQNKYVITLEHLTKLKEQFSGYFSWVRNA